MTDARSAPSLTCPKCMGQMRSYERSGVLVDQCVECRGIYLDRGELERLIDIEGGGRGAAAATPSAAATPTAVATPAAAAPRNDVARRDAPRRDHDDEDDSWADSDRRRAGPADRDGETSRQRRRGGLFGDVFDIFGGGE